MKIKMKLLLLCAAVAPFLMMTSGQQNGSRFGCVCAMEKGNSNEPNEKVPGQEDEKVPDWLWDKYYKNKEILKDYASKNPTGAYDFLCAISSHYADKFSQIYNKHSNANDWQVFCFKSAVLESLLDSLGLGQKVESVKRDIDKKLSKDFPFDHFEFLTSSIWNKRKSSKWKLHKLKLHYFYRGFAYLMHCCDSKSFNDFIGFLCIVDTYMQLFIASLMNLDCVLTSDVNLNKLNGILAENGFRNMNSESVFKDILSCFKFNSKLKQSLLNFYSRFFKQKKSYSSAERDILKQKKAYSSDEPDIMIFWLNLLGSLSSVNEIDTFVNHTIF